MKLCRPAPVSCSSDSGKTSRRTAPLVDWLKALALLGVVIAHTGPAPMLVALPVRDYAVRVVLVAFNVPLFLLLSGYLHATAEPVSLTTIGRRWRRVLGPYLVASLVLLPLGVEHAYPIANWPTELLLGNTLGIYYYVPVWCFCVATGLIWSRLSMRGVAVATAIVLVATVLRSFWPHFGLIWALRDVLRQGWLACYVLGWLARRTDALGMAQRSPWVGAVLLVPWGVTDWPPARVAYTVGVAWLGASIFNRPVPPLVRFYSRETLLVYLWHRPVTYVLVRWCAGLPPLVRIALATTGTLAVTGAGIAVFRLWKPLTRASTAGLAPRPSRRRLAHWWLATWRCPSDSGSPTTTAARWTDDCGTLGDGAAPKIDGIR